MHDVAMCMSQIRHNNLQTCRHTSTGEHKALQSSAKLCVPQFVQPLPSVTMVLLVREVIFSLVDNIVLLAVKIYWVYKSPKWIVIFVMNNK